MEEKPDRLDSSDFEEVTRSLKKCLDWLIRVGVDPRLASLIDREGLVQEAMRKALAWRARTGEAVAFPKAWLKSILKRELVDELERLSKRPDLPADVRAASSDSARGLDRLAGDGERPSQEAVRKEESRRLHEALARLSEMDRQIVTLCKFEEPRLKHAEVAGRLGVSVFVVRRTLVRAMDQLRKELES